MVNVLFVCLGNICRSPMAEALFKDLVEKEGLSDKIHIDSAATGTWNLGKPPHEGTVKLLSEYNISTEGMIARRFTKEDYETFDYIIGMDENNIRDMYELAGQPENRKLIRLLDLTDKQQDVPDPYFTGDFQETYELVSEGCKLLLGKIKEDHLS